MGRRRRPDDYRYQPREELEQYIRDHLEEANLLIVRLLYDLMGGEMIPVYYDSPEEKK